MVGRLLWLVLAARACNHHRTIDYCLYERCLTDWRSFLPGHPSATDRCNLGGSDAWKRDSGWYPIDIQMKVGFLIGLSHSSTFCRIWCLSHSRHDLERIERLPEYLERGDRLEPGSGKGDDLHAGPWMQYLQGLNPQYPDHILENQCQEVLRRMNSIRSDSGEPEEWDVHHWQELNPVRTEALLQTTCGGPQVIYHGGASSHETPLLRPHWRSARASS